MALETSTLRKKCSHTHLKMATQQSGGGSDRVLLLVEGVDIKLSSQDGTLGDKCSLELRNDQLDLVSEERRISLKFSVIKSIDLHQPIFGANYIIGEFIEEGIGHSFTLTFRRGGATDFTRLFFRLAAGELVDSEQQDTVQTSPQEHKKNK